MREFVVLGVVVVGSLTGCPGDRAEPQQAVRPSVVAPARPHASSSTVAPALASRPAQAYQVAASLRLVQGQQETLALIRADLLQGEDGLWEVSALTHDGRPVAVGKARHESALSSLGLPSLLAELSGLECLAHPEGMSSRSVRFAVGKTIVEGQQTLGCDQRGGTARVTARGQLPGSLFKLEIRANSTWEGRLGSLPEDLAMGLKTVAFGGPGEDATSHIQFRMHVEPGAIQ